MLNAAFNGDPGRNRAGLRAPPNDPIKYDYPWATICLPLTKHNHRHLRTGHGLSRIIALPPVLRLAALLAYPFSNPTGSF